MQPATPGLPMERNLPHIFLMRFLSIWLWATIIGAGFMLADSGAGERFWFLLVAAGSSWTCLHLFGRYLADGDR